MIAWDKILIAVCIVIVILAFTFGESYSNRGFARQFAKSKVRSLKRQWKKHPEYTEEELYLAAIRTGRKFPGMVAALLVLLAKKENPGVALTFQMVVIEAAKYAFVDKTKQNLSPQEKADLVKGVKQVIPDTLVIDSESEDEDKIIGWPIQPYQYWPRPWPRSKDIGIDALDEDVPNLRMMKRNIKRAGNKPVNLKLTAALNDPKQFAEELAKAQMNALYHQKQIHPNWLREEQWVEALMKLSGYSEQVVKNIIAKTKGIHAKRVGLNFQLVVIELAKHEFRKRIGQEPRLGDISELVAGVEKVIPSEPWAEFL